MDENDSPESSGSTMNYISHGVSGVRERVVGFVLGLKKYFPEGWVPLLRVIPVKKRRSLPKQYTFGNMGFQGRRGTAHYKCQGRYWKKADVARLLELRADEKLSISDIAEKMDKTYNAVQSKLSYMRNDGTLPSGNT